MDIISLNTERQLLNVASSIGRSPSSWRGWHVLHVSLSGLNDGVKTECLGWTKSIADCYLQDIEGQVYFCDHDGIHIICRYADLKILHEAGSQICDLVHIESGVFISYWIHDLGYDGAEYAQAILDTVGDVLLLSGDQNIPPHQSLPETPKRTISLPSDHIPKVLLVEDDPVTRWMVGNTLKDLCEFEAAPAASKVFSLYSSYQPDIIFLDIDLPDHSGRDVLKWIISNDPGANVIMFSSNNTLENMIETMDEGASGFIGKPFLKTELLNYVQGHMQQSTTH